MIIRYFAMLRDITHRSEQVWDKPAATVQELLESLCGAYGPEFRRWIVDEKGELGGLAIILVNGVDCRSLDGMKTVLRPEDAVAVFPPVAGG